MDVLRWGEPWTIAGMQIRAAHYDVHQVAGLTATPGTRLVRLVDLDSGVMRDMAEVDVRRDCMWHTLWYEPDPHGTPWFVPKLPRDGKTLVAPIPLD